MHSIQAPDQVSVDRAAAHQLLAELLEIPGPSGQEGQVSHYIRRRLTAWGIPSDWVAVDSAHKRTALGGETGNLILRLPASARRRRRLLVAHMDTVPLCVGTKVRQRSRVWESARSGRGLGADDRAGVAVLLATAGRLAQGDLEHPPVTFLWTVQEEVGLQGAHRVNRSALGRCRYAFNWDGGAANKLTIGATGAYRLRIGVEGVASHAGNAPEQGISAITVASLAITRLHQDGWLGLVEKGSQRGTSNLGRVSGGAAVNVVPDRLEVWGEARSHDPAFRQQIVQQIEEAFVWASHQVTRSRGGQARIRFQRQLDYESFCLPPDAAVVRLAQQAVRHEGLEPELAVANGGLDANWLTRHGIPTVSLGCGQRHQHTSDEQLDLDQFDLACRIALRLATEPEGEAYGSG